jgi:hypothetical protein
MHPDGGVSEAARTLIEVVHCSRSHTDSDRENKKFWEEIIAFFL